MITLIKKLLAKEIVRFIISGALATSIHIIIAFLWLHFINLNTFIANFCGFSCAFGVSYICQSLWVFKHKIAFFSCIKFFLVQLSALVVSQLLTEMLTNYSPYIKVLLVVITLPAITFIINKFWTFKSSQILD